MRTKLQVLPMLTAGVLACALVCQKADAVIIDAGVATLESATMPADFLTASYSVDLTGTTYTYSYQVFNPIGDPTRPDQFSVTFNAVLGTSVIAITSGAGIVNTGGCSMCICCIPSPTTDFTLVSQRICGKGYPSTNAGLHSRPNPAVHGS